MEELRERLGFYRGRYHASMPVDYIEHYRNLKVIGTVGTCTGMGAQGRVIRVWEGPNR